MNIVQRWLTYEQFCAFLGQQNAEVTSLWQMLVDISPVRVGVAGVLEVLLSVDVDLHVIVWP